jgi:hypothetical protein
MWHFKVCPETERVLLNKEVWGMLSRNILNFRSPESNANSRVKFGKENNKRLPVIRACI